jgi:alpha-galactosidase
MRITAGMRGTSLSLPPGERITSPSILLGLYDGDSRTGCNSLRRLLYDRYVPLLNGRKPTAPVSWNSWFVLSNSINEELLEREADVAAELGIEYFCIDAGWFDGDFPDGVGNWTVNRSKFPNGLGPIGKYVAAKGMKLGLWFEPERVVAKSRLAREHPEWVHGHLLDLGNPAAREWILKMMRGYIDEGAVGWIRFDFNADPLGTWDGLDAPETRGLAQIRHVMGLYDILDRLRADYPGLLIEGCASGGRRIDLETIKRSHTCWKSDETGSLPVMRFHETGGNVFLPGCLLNANLLAIDNVSSIHSLFGGPLGFGADLTKLSADAKDMTRKTIAEYKQLRGLLDMDYYPLFPQLRDQTGWIGWQFHDPATGKGFFVLLRPDGSPYESAQVHLGGLEKWSNKSVAITEVGSTGRSTMSGAELSRGWLARLLAPGDSKVFSYQIEPSAETRR